MLQVKSIQKTCFLFDEIFSSETWTVATFMDESYHIRNPQQIISQSQLFCTFEVEISGVNIGRMIFKSGGPKKQLQIAPLRCFSDAELHPCFFLTKKGKTKNAKEIGLIVDLWHFGMWGSMITFAPKRPRISDASAMVSEAPGSRRLFRWGWWTTWTTVGGTGLITKMPLNFQGSKSETSVDEDGELDLRFFLFFYKTVGFGRCYIYNVYIYIHTYTHTCFFQC